LKIKLKRRHFDTIEVIEAELQTVLNTLTEHDFQDAGALGTVHTLGRDYFECDGNQKIQRSRWRHQSRELWMAICILE
jgi:hypothetical protein